MSLSAIIQLENLIVQFKCLTFDPVN